MATTVFPKTDDVVTSAAWQSLNDTIDRGNDNGTADTDTNLLKFEEDASGSTALSTAPQTVTELSLDAGKTYYVRGCISIIKSKTNPTQEDPLEVGISLGSGLTAYVAACRSNAAVSGSTDFLYGYTFTGPSDNIMLTNIKGATGVLFQEEPVLWVDMIVVADQDAVLSWYYVKGFDIYDTWYRPDEVTYLIATPIRG